MSYDIDKLISVLQAEIGYCEKRSNSQLDSKTANAGSGNYVKYWRDLYPTYQGQSWCDCLCSWAMVKAYGKTAANELTCGGLYSFYTPTSAQLYKNKGQWHTGSDVKRGDQIFFKNSTRIHHTGIVTDVKNGRIYTIEGNTSNGTAVVANGGMVCAKNYKIGLSTIAGYGRPNYGTQTTTASTSFDYHSIYDDDYYKSKYSDIKQAYGTKNAYDHYATNGVKEARSACAKFDPVTYRRRYSDLDKAYGDNWEGYAQHYVTYGVKEGRNAAPDTTVTNSNAAQNIGTVTTDLNVRVYAGVEYPKCSTFGPIKAGEKVEIVRTVKDRKGADWYLVKYDGKEGFCKAEFITR